MDAASPPLLDIVDLRKNFGGLHAIDGLSFTVNKGEILGICGPNGAGKTTLFDLISGISPISGGKIIHSGEDISGLSAGQICRRGMARTFQFNAGFDSLTIEQSVFIGALFGHSNRGFRYRFISSSATAKLVEEALAFVGLEDRRGVAIALASVLERKLSMVACALATGPQLMMLDEPVGGLVRDEMERLSSLVQALRDRGITIILIEHAMQFLTSLSDRVIIMHHGKKLFEGTPREMYRDQDVVDVYLGSAPPRGGSPELVNG